MASRNRKGPAPKGDEAPSIDQLGGAIDGVGSAASEAEQALADMLANGATFTPQHRDDGLPSFVYEVAGAGDRERCREILRTVKAKPDVWSAMARLVCASLSAEAPHG